MARKTRTGEPKETSAQKKARLAAQRVAAEQSVTYVVPGIVLTFVGLFALFYFAASGTPDADL
jgi:hypothetical protein